MLKSKPQHIAIAWYISQKCVATFRIAAAIVVHAVADNQVRGFDYAVVAGNLVENILSQYYVGGFVFYNTQRLQRAGVDQRVGSSCGIVELQRHLVCHKFAGKGAVGD